MLISPRAVPADGWCADYSGKRPQTKPHTQKGPLTAGQISELRAMPAFREMEAKMLAAHHVVPKMVEGDL